MIPVAPPTVPRKETRELEEPVPARVAMCGHVTVGVVSARGSRNSELVVRLLLLLLLLLRESEPVLLSLTS